MRGRRRAERPWQALSRQPGATTQTVPMTRPQRSVNPAIGSCGLPGRPAISGVNRGHGFAALREPHRLNPDNPGSDSSHPVSADSRPWRHGGGLAGPPRADIGRGFAAGGFASLRPMRWLFRRRAVSAQNLTVICLPLSGAQKTLRHVSNFWLSPSLVFPSFGLRPSQRSNRQGSGEARLRGNLQWEDSLRCSSCF
jgi:hypothetical protein